MTSYCCVCCRFFIQESIFQSREKSLKKIKGEIRICKSEKDRQHNEQKDKQWATKHHAEI